MSKKILKPDSPFPVQTEMENQLPSAWSEPISPPTPLPADIVELSKSTIEQSKASKADDMKSDLNDDFMSKFGGEFKEPAVVPSLQEVKAKRGRRAGGKNAPKIPPQEFRPQESKPLFVGAVINGAIFITIIDIFMPMIIAGVHNQFNENKIKPSDLKMPKETRSELEPLCNEVIKSMNIQMDPKWALLLTVVSMYGMSYMTAVNKK